VLAFGGNALLPDAFHPEEQEPRAHELARIVRVLLDRSPGLVLVHGNGPQVGMILLRVEAARGRLPSEPLDVLVSETQGSIGYLLTRTLRNALVEHAPPIEVACVLTQVVVDPADPAFATPTKPIGPAYSDDVAATLRDQRGWRMVHEDGRGWRRVVPSPEPRSVVELGSIYEAARAGHVVVAGGGGGIPVRRDAAGELVGVEAVIDKDRTASMLAIALRAHCFVVLTGVPHVSLDFATPDERRVERLSSGEAQRLVDEGVFPAGSMGPKVEAAARFAFEVRRPALITDTASLEDALDGRAGTRIDP
jgi:carbamate kinase